MPPGRLLSACRVRLVGPCARSSPRMKLDRPCAQARVQTDKRAVRANCSKKSKKIPNCAFRPPRLASPGLAFKLRPNPTVDISRSRSCFFDGSGRV